MTRYTVDLTRTELDLICETISTAGFPAAGSAEVWGDSEAQILTVALSETAIDCLSRLPEHTDWHCSDGQLYADGAAYPLTVVHNARPGRPTVGGRVTVSLSPDRLARIDAAAALARISRAEMLRRIIDAALDGRTITVS